jgi:hypothetical protein
MFSDAGIRYRAPHILLQASNESLQLRKKRVYRERAVASEGWFLKVDQVLL